VVGTTWHGQDATLGSANVGEFWLQRRPLIGYWREPDDLAWGPVRVAKLHLVKDDHDFSSAVIGSVQSGSQVLWSVGFVSPGGDEHIGLNKIGAGEAFPVRSLRLVLEIAGVADAKVEVAGRQVTETPYPMAIGEQLRISTPAVDLISSIDSISFGDHEPVVGLVRSGDRILLTADLLPEGKHELTLLDIAPAELTGTFSIFEGPDRPAVAAPLISLQDGQVRADWTTPTGERLQLTAPARVGPPTGHPIGVRATIDGSPLTAGGLAALDGSEIDVARGNKQRRVSIVADS
jgi:hypothetical protein